MERLFKRSSNRVILFRLWVLGILLAVAGIISFYLVRPSQADLDAEKRLVGRWGIWLEKYDPSIPPGRIIEWKSDGHIMHYSPELEPLGDTAGNQDVSSAWRIRDDQLITETRNPRVFRGTMRESNELIWESDDAFVMLVRVASGRRAPVYYRRMVPANQ